MYCKLYIHCDSRSTLIDTLQKKFGNARCDGIASYKFEEFSIDVHSNKESDKQKQHIYPDGFLFYELLADLDIEGDYVRITDSILRFLWEMNYPAVACCDYEDEINKRVLL